MDRSGFKTTSDIIVVPINMFRFKWGDCLSVFKVVNKELECNLVILLN